MKFVRPLLTKSETRGIIELIDEMRAMSTINKPDRQHRLERARHQLEKALGEAPVGWKEKSRGG